MEYKDIEKTCYLHHTSWCRGYVSRMPDRVPVCWDYNGRFGKGYKVYLPSWQSTTYCHVEYWIFK